MNPQQDPHILTIINKLRQIIKERKLKQKKIAADAGIPFSTFNSFLKGKANNPTFLLILKVSKAIGINSIDYLMGKPVINPSELHKKMFEAFDSMSEVGKERFIEFAKFMKEKNGI